MSNQPAPPAVETPERLAFYDRISRKHLTPLWVSLANLVTPEPVSACQPAAWSFTEIRAAMMEAGELITAKEAQRRFVLEGSGAHTAVNGERTPMHYGDSEQTCYLSTCDASKQ